MRLNVRPLIWDLAPFLLYAISAAGKGTSSNVVGSSNFSICSFKTLIPCFKIPRLISPVACGLLKNMLFCFWLIGDFPEILPWLISDSTPLCSENTLDHNGQTEWTPTAWLWLRNLQHRWVMHKKRSLWSSQCEKNCKNSAKPLLQLQPQGRSSGRPKSILVIISQMPDPGPGEDHVLSTLMAHQTTLWYPLCARTAIVTRVTGKSWTWPLSLGSSNPTGW